MTPSALQAARCIPDAVAPIAAIGAAARSYGQSARDVAAELGRRAGEARRERRERAARDLEAAQAAWWNV